MPSGLSFGAACAPFSPPATAPKRGHLAVVPPPIPLEMPPPWPTNVAPLFDERSMADRNFAVLCEETSAWARAMVAESLELAARMREGTLQRKGARG